MSVAPVRYISRQDYLERERKAAHKSEYYRGEIFAMVGASVTHNLIAGNTITALNNLLRGRGCRVYPSDLRVACPSGLYTYPDVTMICGEHQFDDDRRDTLTNPQVLFEILSETTKAYDFGTKFQLYRTISSLRSYVLIDQSSPLVFRYDRQGDADHCLLTFSSGLDAVLELPDFEFAVPLQQIYENVEFSQPAAEETPKTDQRPELN
ncbi:MAG: Uma2 family endonuclease [Planctomycetaceae bacterium]|nr:Uma2 family endonuclease [Planctomycetaceae bacterium]